MTLRKYQEKRNFKESPEPKGGKPEANTLVFVVQKHQASRLHYDFRLELGGKLKSWAVPKGPSLDPQDKRLAMEVEDHPYDYKDFEGIIPKGNYGAGTVIVWDQGTFEPIIPYKGKKQAESILRKQYKEGSIKIRLNGEKLNGEFALVRLKSNEEKAWLLIKHKDEFSRKGFPKGSDRSVQSGRTLAEVKEENPKVTFKPMLATLGQHLPTHSEDWLYEVKWDGYRMLAEVDHHQVQLWSRNQQSYNERFYMIREALQELNIQVVFDGEVIALNALGKPDFQILQQGPVPEEGVLLYYIFDVLSVEGKQVTHWTLEDRKALLQKLLPQNTDIIKRNDPLLEKPQRLLDAMQKMGFEGLVAKKKSSVYLPGKRSPDWLKFKIEPTQEVVIVGYIFKNQQKAPFSALLLGVYEEGKLRYAGRAGSGFKESEKQSLYKKFQAIKRKTSPLADEAALHKGNKWQRDRADEEIQWLRPQLVAEIKYTEITPNKVFRHPVFLGLRTDKSADAVEMEAMEKGSLGAALNALPMKKNSLRAQFAAHQQKSKTSKFSTTIQHKTLHFSRLDKILWPESGITKGDMLDYYAEIAPFILPYLKDRPQSLHRLPNGSDKPGFFQKDMTDTAPDWVERYPYKAKGERKQKHYMLCQNKASLLFMANLGAIEMHPWNSTIQKPENPTWCAIDLDPDTSNSFEQVIEVAQAVHAFLEEHKIPSCVKTSGSTGLHIYIPLGAQYDFAQSQMLAQWVVSEVDELFDFTSIVRPTQQRKGTIYLDYLQNRPSATLAAPYSLRPKPLAPVSMPLHWSEIKSGLQITDFTIANALQRVKEEGDLFKMVLQKGIDLKKILGVASQKA